MGAQQIHDKYGKDVLRKAFGDLFNDDPDPESFGENAGTCKVDGTIGTDVAVEIESRASKQARGAVLDLLVHPCPKKLMVLIPKYGNGYTEQQCRVLLKRFGPNVRSEVVTLKGDGANSKYDEDVGIVSNAVARLRNVQAAVRRKHL